MTFTLPRRLAVQFCSVLDHLFTPGAAALCAAVVILRFIGFCVHNTPNIDKTGRCYIGACFRPGRPSLILAVMHVILFSSVEFAVGVCKTRSEENDQVDCSFRPFAFG